MGNSVSKYHDKRYDEAWALAKQLNIQETKSRSTGKLTTCANCLITRLIRSIISEPILYLL